MIWERLDLFTLQPDILKLIAAATDPGSRLTNAAIRETALALLIRARALPALPVPDDDVPAAMSWLGTRYVGEKGQTEISFWKDDADALFQAEWENKSLRSLLVQIGERIWTSDPEHLQGWDYDPHRVLEKGDDAQTLSDWKSRAEEVVAAWDRENHPKVGWRCGQCGWQNRAEDTACTVCSVAQHPVASNPRAEWKEHAAVPPPPFDEPPLASSNTGGTVELNLPTGLDAILPKVPAGAKPAPVAPARVPDRVPVVDAASAGETGPRLCWRCKTELKPPARICPSCGADQEAPQPAKPARPTNLPE